MSVRNHTSSPDPLAGGFGFDPRESVAHFLVHIPASAQHLVEISEHLSWDEKTVGLNQQYGVENSDGQVRVKLPRLKWNDLADAVRAEFNNRLRVMGRKPGKWRTGFNPVHRSLGKELVLLGWAIEDADPMLTRTAIMNWQGLAPEERWWLYTMTAAASGHALTGRGVGWRKAVRYALTENPLSAAVQEQRVVPEFFRFAESVNRSPKPESTEADVSHVPPDASDVNADPQPQAEQVISSNPKRRSRKTA